MLLSTRNPNIPTKSIKIHHLKKKTTKKTMNSSITRHLALQTCQHPWWLRWWWAWNHAVFQRPNAKPNGNDNCLTHALWKLIVAKCSILWDVVLFCVKIWQTSKSIVPYVQPFNLYIISYNYYTLIVERKKWCSKMLKVYNIIYLMFC